MSECALLRVEGAIRQAEERATAAVLRRDKMSRARMTRSTYIYIYIYNSDVDLYLDSFMFDSGYKSLDHLTLYTMCYYY